MSDLYGNKSSTCASIAALLGACAAGLAFILWLHSPILPYLVPGKKQLAGTPNIIIILQMQSAR